MPLPSHPLTINGGCNCQAICYKISIPSLQDRPIIQALSNQTASARNVPTPEVHLPMIIIDHCNDCRRGTGALINFGICNPTTFVSFSLLPRSEPSTSLLKEQSSRGPLIPASEIYFHNSQWSREDTYLAFYESSPGRTRSFCSRCGTSVGVSVPDMPPGWPSVLDIPLGSVDREELEGEWAVPERQMFWERGIGWVKEFARNGLGDLPVHPGGGVYNFVVKK